MKRTYGTSIVTMGLAATLIAGCGGSGGGGGGGTTAPPVTGTGDITSSLPTPSRANTYAFQEFSLNNVQNAGVVTALGVAPNATDTLAIHTPLNEVERIDANGTSTEDSFFSQSRSIATVGTLVFAATTDQFLNGSGDVYQRIDFGGGATQWRVALDTDRSEMVVGSANGEVYGVAGGIGQQGEVFRYDPGALQFTSVAQLSSTVGTALTEFEGDVWIGGMDNVSGSAKLFRMRMGAIEEIQYPYAAGGARQEVRAMLSVANVVSGVGPVTTAGETLILAVGSFDSATGEGVGGAVVATDGQDFEVMQSYSGDAPTSLAFADNTVYVGTAKGKLQYREANGSWTDETGMPANEGIFSLLARDAATLFVGARGANGALLVQRVANGVTVPSQTDRYYLPDVKNLLANDCALCHTNAALVNGAMELSQGMTDDDADYAAVEAVAQPTQGNDPASSLLLQKASASVAHTGATSVTYTPGSQEYELLVDWIEQGARKEQAQAPTPTPTPTPTPNPALTYAADIKPILTGAGQNCQSCHTGRTGANQFTYTGNDDTADYNNLLAFTDGGNAAQSEILLRNDGTQNHQIMAFPQGDPERDTIIQWINDGRQP